MPHLLLCSSWVAARHPSYHPPTCEKARAVSRTPSRVAVARGAITECSISHSCSVLPAAAANRVESAGQKATSDTSDWAVGSWNVHRLCGCASLHSRTDQSAEAVRKWEGLKGDQQTCV